MNSASIPSPREASPTPTHDLSPRTLKSFALGLVALGVVWRILRYLLNFPIWGDEAMLALNFASFDYGELTSKLSNLQIAPILFLWGERLALTSFGPDERSLRLLPLLASLGSLALYWRLTGLLLDPMARLFAIGFLAVAMWPVSMGSLIKPYSLDLFVALLLLTLAVHWLRRTNQKRWLVALALVVPLAPLASYPSVFVGGAVSLVLVVAVWRQGWAARSWFAVYNAGLLLGFALTIVIGNRHLANTTSGSSTQEGMQSYWASAFPPHGLLPFAKWFVLQTTGQMTAYPIGAERGGSIVTVALVIAGVVLWIRQRQTRWLLLLLAPLALNLIAAVLHRYPFGGSCRLSQALAPSVCILAGLGSAFLIHRFAGTSIRQRRWVVGAVCLFALVGVGGAAIDIAFPYRAPAFAFMRSTWAAIRAEVAPSDAVVVDMPISGLEPVFAWHLLVEHPRTSWYGELPSDLRSGDRVWGFSGGSVPDSAALLGEKLRRRDPSWRLVKRIPFTHEKQNRKDIAQWFELVCYERGSETIPADPPGNVISARPTQEPPSRR